MEKGVFGFIWRFSKRQQITLLVMTAVSYPFYYYSLDLPKTIVNEAIGGENFPATVLGAEFGQIEFLMVLSFTFLGLVIINGALKYIINVYRGVVGERMLRRLRYQLVNHVLRFPLPQFRSVSEGEVVAMVTTETEPLGGFVGEALSLPAFQGGMLITALIFMFVQDPILGIAAIALYPVQGWLIPKLQKRVNQLAKARVQTVRKLSERISETVAGAGEIHAHDTAQFELADFSQQLGTIFGIRMKIYKLKFLIKFINNFLAQVTPFFFFSIGGYLVIEGELSIGALVAILAAYKDLGPPWKELLNFYQRMEDARIKYDQLVDRFTPPGLMAEDMLAPLADSPPEVEGPIVASNVGLKADDGDSIIESANFQFNPDQHVSFVGGSGGGKNEVAQLLARQIVATSGTIKVNNQDIATLPESFIGRRFGYVDQDAYIRSGTVRDNLFYGLKHYPVNENADPESRKAHEQRVSEAESSGNSIFDINAGWIADLSGSAEDEERLLKRAREALSAVGLELDILTIGLRSTIDPEQHPNLAEGILRARKEIATRLNDEEFKGLVEIWRRDAYNRNGSVAENILFGTPVGDTFALDALGANAIILQALDETGLRERFVEMGRDVAALMVELFKDLPPGHEFFERYSFIESDDLPEFQSMLTTAGNSGLEALSDDQRRRLLELPFRLIPSKHRLGLITPEVEEQLLKLRDTFHRIIPEEHATAVSFFEADSYNPASSILDNMLLGKIDSSRSDASERIMELAVSVLDHLDLRLPVLDAGLSSEVGIAGRRLSTLQRQKLAIARNLVKEPSVLVVNEATSSFDGPSQSRAMDAIASAMQDKALVWIGDEDVPQNGFDVVYRVDGGRVREATAQSDDEGEKQTTDETAAASDVGADTELLSRIPFFAGLDRSRLKLLAFTSERQTLEPREVLFLQGDPGDMACVIVEGSCDVIAETSERRIKVAEIGRGGLIGELALLCEAPRTATVQAEGRTTVLKITKDVFMQLIKENPAVGANLSRILASKLEQMMRGMSAQYELYDPVTGLPNRNLFIDYMKTAAVTQERLGDQSTLLIFDMSGLVSELEAAGLDAQQAVTRVISNRVKPVVRSSDTLGSLGTLRLGVIARESGQVPSTQEIIRRITEVLSAPIEHDEATYMADKHLTVEEAEIERGNLQTLMGMV